MVCFIPSTFCSRDTAVSVSSSVCVVLFLSVVAPSPYIGSVIYLVDQRSSNQDLVRLQVYTDPDEAWNTNIYHADKKEMEGAVQRKKLGVLSKFGFEISSSTRSSRRQAFGMASKRPQQTTHDSARWSARGHRIPLPKCLAEFIHARPYVLRGYPDDGKSCCLTPPEGYSSTSLHRESVGWSASAFFHSLMPGSCTIG